MTSPQLPARPAPTTAREHLAHIADQWPALRELLTASTPTTWPPAGRIADQERLVSDLDQETARRQARQEYADRDPTAPGERPVPLRLGALDTMEEITTALCGLADQIAAQVQRPVINATVRGATILDEVARSMAMLALQDRLDINRWEYGHRDVLRAVGWLDFRLHGPAGPCQALAPAHRQQILTTARRCTRLLDTALGETTPEPQRIGRPCACGGHLALTTADDPAQIRVACETCEIAWTGPELLRLLDTA